MLNPRLFRLLMAAACAALFGADPANAAGGKITGTVSDALTGYALPDANVLLVETEAGAETDAEGRFFFLNVAPGMYTLRVTYVGYRPVTMEGVRVSADLTTDLEFVLGSEAIEVEEVVIKAERPIIDK
ncbi:MAG: carboxypeptidase-like regulatory domain-containing protein, partial [Gemmatimonadetes bacterium]|nr:carboxypeptidase-like regulatory domain-containing protein [Gemmatimonadota bacterium]